MFTNVGTIALLLEIVTLQYVLSILSNANMAAVQMFQVETTSM
jgi:hypothetical protein